MFEYWVSLSSNKTSSLSKIRCDFFNKTFIYRSILSSKEIYIKKKPVKMNTSTLPTPLICYHLWPSTECCYCSLKNMLSSRI